MGQVRSIPIPLPTPVFNPPLMPPIIPFNPDIGTKTDRMPQVGDHIYSERSGGLYDHHGIYVGNDMVIHLQGPAAPKKIGDSTCQKCGDKRDCQGGIIKTCLDCFLDGHTLYFYEYGVPFLVFNTKKRGTCTLFPSKPAEEVVKRAHNLLHGNCFKDYNFFAKNCEDFAVYCKSGMAVSMQAIGGVEAASKMLAPGGSLFGLVPNVGAVGIYSLAKVIHEASHPK